MAYTPEQITAHIEHRAHCIGEDSKDVRMLRQLAAEVERMRAVLEGALADPYGPPSGQWVPNARAALSTQENSHD